MIFTAGAGCRINKLMRDGKKNTASRIFYGACRLIQERTGQDQAGAQCLYGCQALLQKQPPE